MSPKNTTQGWMNGDKFAALSGCEQIIGQLWENHGAILSSQQSLEARCYQWRDIGHGKDAIPLLLNG